MLRVWVRVVLCGRARPGPCAGRGGRGGGDLRAHDLCHEAVTDRARTRYGPGTLRPATLATPIK
ncbi:hypothetical protein F1D59_04175 [Streptomyces sp. INR7]|nr:hypothetical protein F1D59_04175 [Streptomyces sp. INR7]